MVAPFRQYDVPTRKIITTPKCHHFFVVDPDYRYLADVQGKVLVFLSVKYAETFAARMPVLANGFMVIGMGDKKWELFQKTEDYRIVEDDQ